MFQSNLNALFWMTSLHLSPITITMADDNLGIPGARASAAMLSGMLVPDIDQVLLEYFILIIR